MMQLLPAGVMGGGLGRRGRRPAVNRARPESATRLPHGPEIWECTLRPRLPSPVGLGPCGPGAKPAPRCQDRVWNMGGTAAGWPVTLGGLGNRCEIHSVLDAQLRL